MSTKPAESNVKTALRVIEIIELFARETRPLALSEMARLLDAPVSSCLALLRTLSRQGYIYETGVGKVITRQAVYWRWPSVFLKQTRFWKSTPQPGRTA